MPNRPGAGRAVFCFFCGFSSWQGIKYCAPADVLWGRNLRLEPPKSGAPLNTFGYPYAEVGGTPLDFYNPKGFSYRCTYSEK